MWNFQLISDGMTITEVSKISNIHRSGRSENVSEYVILEAEQDSINV